MPDATPPNTTNHHISYVEFSARDFAKVKSFYADAFGWSFTEWGEDYLAFDAAGIEGGFAKGEAKEGALVILYSDDLDATQRAVEEAGGTITEPQFDFPGGRRFHFRAPDGNVLAAFTAKED